MPAAHPSDLYEIASERAANPERLKMEASIVARGSSLLAKRSFRVNLLWRNPDTALLRVLSREGFTLLQVLQQSGYLRILNEADREHPIFFVGPLASIDPEVAERIPLDVSALALVPLVDSVFAQRLPHLSLIDRPSRSCWRDHLFFQGDPSTSLDPWWRRFDDEIWAVRPETGTVEGVALEMPGLDGEDPLWIWLVIDQYEEIDGNVLPTQFQLSLVERPWRRWRQGERWVVEAEVTQHWLNAPIRDAAFQLIPPPGVEVYPLSALDLR